MMVLCDASGTIEYDRRTPELYIGYVQC